MTKYISISLLSVALCALSCTNASRFSPEITAEDIKEHITYLASDSLKGRDTGSYEETVAATYITERFKEAGLLPLGDAERFTQEFDVVKGSTEGKSGSQLRLDSKIWTSATDSILAWGASGSGETTGELVLAGYGIKAPKLNYNEITSSLKDKIVLIMRYGPDGDSNPHGTFGAFWELDKKISSLIDAGVKGILITDGPLYSAQALTMKYKRGKARVEIPVIQLHSTVAAQLAELAGQNLSSYQKKLNKTQKPTLIFTKKTVEIKTEVQDQIVIAKNVVGLLKGTSSEKGAIVIGAHYDHLGMGGSSSLASSKEPQIHNGADDNASGTAGVLELAHYFSKNRIQHDLVFIGFSGEELGLLGSDYYVNNPTYPIESMRAMINMDMIGRMKNRNLIIFGTGTANNWDTLLTTANTEQLDIKGVPDGSGASDHTSFYNKQLPVLHYFTDTHSDYHRPSDDTEFINAFGEKMALDHLARVVQLLDTTSKESFYYTKAPETQRRNMRMSGTTLGVIPDYGFRGEGMRITGATEGRPGAKAGLKDGDVLLELGSKKLKDIYDYMEALNQFKKGDKTSVKVKRGESTLTLEVTF